MHNRRAFQVFGVIFTGLPFLMLACLGYVPGWFFYKKARGENDATMSKGEITIAVILSVIGIISIPLTFIGFIPVF